MGFPKKTKEKEINLFGPNNQPMFNQQSIKLNESEIIERFNMFEKFMNESIRMMNNQGNALKNAYAKISQLSFMQGKMEEELQILRVSNRMLRDKFNTSIKGMHELGIVDEEIFSLIFSKLESKFLPVNSDGQINGNVLMQRFNPPGNIPHPENMRIE